MIGRRMGPRQAPPMLPSPSHAVLCGSPPDSLTKGREPRGDRNHAADFRSVRNTSVSNAGDVRTGDVESPRRRQHGIQPNQLFTWRRLYAAGALSAVGSGEEVVPASNYRALQHQVRELQRLLGKKTLETEILREALDFAQPKKGCCARPPPVRTARHEGSGGCAQRGTLKPGGAGSAEACPTTPWAPASA